MHRALLGIGGSAKAVSPIRILQVITHNLLELLKAAALDPAYRQARPKRLRFAIFNQVGRVVCHAHQQFVRVASRVLEGLLRPAQRRVLAVAWPAL